MSIYPYIVRAEIDASVDLGIDAAYVTNGVTNVSKLCQGENGDLWQILSLIISGRDGHTNIFKVKSHLDKRGVEAIRNKEINVLNLVGNTLADKVAEEMATLIKPSYASTEAAKMLDIMGFTIAKRLAIIQADIWESQDHNDIIYELPAIPASSGAKQKDVNATLIAKAVQCGHRIHKCDKGHKCENCLVYKTHSKFKYWTEHKCSPRPNAMLVVKRRRLTSDTDGDREPCSGNMESTDTLESSSKPTEMCDQGNSLDPYMGETMEHTVTDTGEAVGKVEVFDDTLEADPGDPWLEEPTDETADVSSKPTVTCDQGNSLDSSKGETLEHTVKDIGEAVGKSKGYAYTSLDDSDAEAFDEDPDADPGDPWLEEPTEEDPTAHGSSSFQSEHNGNPRPVKRHKMGPALFPQSWVAKGKRLTGKQSAAHTPYAAIIPLGNKKAQMTRKRKVKEILIVGKAASLKAHRTALRTVASNLEKVEELVDEQGLGNAEYDFSRTDGIHSSHHIKPIASNAIGVYCERCGAWFNGGPLRNMKNPCPGHIEKSRTFQIRLLKLGIVPKVGARIPQHNKKKWTRERRGYTLRRGSPSGGDSGGETSATSRVKCPWQHHKIPVAEDTLAWPVKPPAVGGILWPKQVWG